MGEIRITHDVFGIEGLCVVEPKTYEDNRGNFREIYNNYDYSKEGLTYQFVQDNEVYSKKGVLRGFHVNRNHPQAKLIRVISGKILDVVIDLRKESPTYKKCVAVELSENNNKQLYVPEGMGHGYLALEDSVLQFKVTTHYVPGDEINFSWKSSFIDVKWPEMDVPYVLNNKDLNSLDFDKLDL